MRTAVAQTVSMDRGYSVMGWQSTEYLISAREERIGADHQSSCPQLDQSWEKCIELVFNTGVQNLNFNAADRAPVVSVSAIVGLLGLTRSARTRALGRSWWSTSSFFDVSTPCRPGALAYVSGSLCSL